MPRPCAVEAHARSYKTQRKDFCGCHGLAPWRLTLAATKHSGKTFADATALRRGGSRSQLQNTAERLLRMPRPCAAEAHARSYKTQRKDFCGCHGLVPRRLTLAATKHSGKTLRMPRPCAGEGHARHYKTQPKDFGMPLPCAVEAHVSDGT